MFQDEDEEELHENPFFLALQKQSDLFNYVKKERLTVCVPTGSSLPFPLSRVFLHQHIFRPSKEVIGDFVSLERGLVRFEGRKILVKEGYEDHREVTITSEETFYNQFDQPFRVLIIDRSLYGRPNPSKNREELVPSKPTYMNAVGFFSGVECLPKVEKMVTIFCATYVAVEGYEQYVVSKVRQIYNKAVAQLEQDPKIRALLTKQKAYLNFKNLTSSFILGLMYVKIFDEVCKPKMGRKDAWLRELCCNCAEKITMEDIGIPAQFQADPEPALRCFELLDAHLSPYEKLSCIKDSLSEISQAVASLSSSSPPSSPTSSPTTPRPSPSDSLTSDDLIPWLSYIILLSKPKYLHSNLFYMEEFMLLENPPSSLMFCLTTLAACVQFLGSDFFLDVVREKGVEVPVEGMVGGKKGRSTKMYSHTVVIHPRPESFPNRRPLTRSSSLTSPSIPSSSSSSSGSSSSSSPSSSSSSSSSPYHPSSLSTSPSSSSFSSSSPTSSSPFSNTRRGNTSPSFVPPRSFSPFSPSSSPSDDRGGSFLSFFG